MPLGLALLLLVSASSAITFQPGWNHRAVTPPMGWRPWNCFRADLYDSRVRAVATALSVRNRTVKGEAGLVSLCDLGYCDVGIGEGYEVRAATVQ